MPQLLSFASTTRCCSLFLKQLLLLLLKQLLLLLLLFFLQLLPLSCSPPPSLICMVGLPFHMWNSLLGVEYCVPWWVYCHQIFILHDTGRSREMVYSSGLFITTRIIRWIFLYSWSRVSGGHRQCWHPCNNTHKHSATVTKTITLKQLLHKSQLLKQLLKNNLSKHNYLTITQQIY